MSIVQTLIPEWMVPMANNVKKTIKKNRAQIEYSLMFIGSIYALTVMVGSAILYYFIQEPFTLFSHWFSNMGVGITGWAFNQGLQGTAILYSAMIIIFSLRFRNAKKSTKIMSLLGTLFGIIAVIGIFILTTNNMVEGRILHLIGAYMYFVATPFFTTFETVALALEGSSSKQHWMISLLLVILSISMAPLMSIIGNSIGIPLAEVLGSMDSHFGIVRLIEWASVLFFFIWIFFMGLQYRNYVTNVIKKE